MSNLHNPSQDDDAQESGLRRNKGDGVSPGEMIREGRTAHDYSVADLCAQTKLSAKTVAALEDNDFNELSQPVFARGYYRQCAKVLDLDSDKLMAAYAAWSGEPAVAPSRVAPQSFAPPPTASPTGPASSGYEPAAASAQPAPSSAGQSPASTRASSGNSKPGGFPFVGLLLFLVIVGIVVAILFLMAPNLTSKWTSRLPSLNSVWTSATQPFQSGSDSSQQSAPDAGAGTGSSQSNDNSTDPGATDSTNTTGTTDTTDSQATGPDASGQTPQTGRTSGGRNVNRTLGITPPNQQASDNVDTSTPAVAPNHLKLTSNERSWMQVTDADGNRLAAGIMEKGDSQEFDGKPPYKIDLGFAPGVAISIGGQSVDVAGQTGGSAVAHLTVGKPDEN